MCLIRYSPALISSGTCHVTVTWLEPRTIDILCHSNLYRRGPNGGKISLLFVCLMVDPILLADRYSYSPPFLPFFFRDRKFFRYLASFMIALCVFYILQMYNMHDVTILNFIQRNWRFLFEKKKRRVEEFYNLFHLCVVCFAMKISINL